MSNDANGKRKRRTILKSCTNPKPSEIYRAAMAYREAGLSFIPIMTGGEKEPAIHLLPKIWCERGQRYRPQWSPFKSEPPTKDQIKQWFLPKNNSPPHCGLAIIAGKVSGNLEILDLDTFDLIEPFKAEVERRMPGLLDRLVQVMTPRPGLHLYYRCPEIGGSVKVAKIEDPDSEKPKPKAIIETKGEGGYVLAPPSPPGCHPKWKCYLYEGDKDLTQIPTITPAERQVLLEAARSLDRWKHVRPPRPARPVGTPSGIPKTDRPGDDFNVRGEWADILLPHGWTYAGVGGDGTDRWTRPGKAEGCSATTNVGGSDLLYVFSTNADPFDSEQAYTKFEAYTLLYHDDDFSSAALALRKKGYGKPRKRPNRPGRRKPTTSSRRRRRLR